MTDRELMQMALDSLEHHTEMTRPLVSTNETIKGLRARLSQCDRCGEVNPAEIHTCTPKQPEQEPVAWVDNRVHGWPDCVVMEPDPPHTSPLYTAPPQRECEICGKVAKP